MGELDWEAIIADGGSEDGTREVVAGYARRHVRLRLIDNPGRIASTGLNAALRVARGEIVLRLDAHTRYAPDYCAACVATLLATGADNVGGPARTEAAGARARAIAGAYHSRFSTGGARFHREDYEGWVDTVPYGCWRREVFERLGGFDETLVRNQDDEFNLRLRRAGGRIWQNPRIRSWYAPRATLRALFGQYAQYGFWKVAVIRKHGAGSWRHLTPAAFVLAQVSLAGGTLGSLLAGGVPGWWGAGWALLNFAYAASLLAASLVTARRHGWDTLPWLPAAFATFHCAYGLGFLAGLGAELRRGRRVDGDSIFNRLTHEHP